MALDLMELVIGMKELQTDLQNKHPKQLHLSTVHRWSDSSAQMQMLPLCALRGVANVLASVVQPIVACQVAMVFALPKLLGRAVALTCHQQRHPNQSKMKLPLLEIHT